MLRKPFPRGIARVRPLAQCCGRGGACCCGGAGERAVGACAAASKSRPQALKLMRPREEGPSACVLRPARAGRGPSLLPLLLLLRRRRRRGRRWFRRVRGGQPGGQQLIRLLGRRAVAGLQLQAPAAHRVPPEHSRLCVRDLHDGAARRRGKAARTSARNACASFRLPPKGRNPATRRAIGRICQGRRT